MTFSGEFLRRALNAGDSQKISREAKALTARARANALVIIDRLNGEAVAEAAAIARRERERRVRVWLALPWWKRLLSAP